MSYKFMLWTGGTIFIAFSSLLVYIWYLKSELENLELEKEKLTLTVARQNLAVLNNKLDHKYVTQQLIAYEKTVRTMYTPNKTDDSTFMKTPTTAETTGYCESKVDSLLQKFGRNEQ